ncbi:MAG: DUF4926 domain-containing protein [Caldilineaceae bacterium SB0664_bin_27]|uniref:DUF4926 domain-containing protein n=1 Tax=Caldilineaceae bacterium SB0664_bin_27 TaxID=2605260 RepID=A0A6B0YU46_9CHLR|nr:DUF4926 domain-containing protein [Caldilineaceae bacterium SB0664_bin_27]
MVALTADLPELNLSRGQVGTVVEVLSRGFAFEVEFSDPEGRALETVALRPDQLVARPHKFWRTKPTPDDPEF